MPDTSSHKRLVVIASVALPKGGGLKDTETPQQARFLAVRKLACALVKRNGKEATVSHNEKSFYRQLCGSCSSQCVETADLDAYNDAGSLKSRILLHTASCALGAIEIFGPMRISEIFVSLQGEGSRALFPSIFVRLQGCNLRCHWCDTRYARDTEYGELMSAEQVIERVKGFGIQEVCVTGGEPLLQKDTPDLLCELCSRGFRVTLMTNGTCSFDRVPREVVKIVDIKSPWSQQANVPPSFVDEFKNLAPFGFRMENLSFLTKTDEVKFVVRSRSEFDWALYWVQAQRLFDRVAYVFLGPAFGILSPDTLAQWIIASRLPLRLNLQLHKFIFGKDTRL